MAQSLENINTVTTPMPPTIALVMIVKNEAACLERCLSSVSGLVDEMIVMDTGSSDATVQIAKRLGAQVHHFKWNDDFAAARNAALDLSNAEWNLVLDADEWVISGHETLGNLANEGFIGQIAVVSTFDQTGSEGTATDWISRLLPRSVRYTGRIHEQPDGASLPRRHIGLKVGHDGYLSQHLATKQGRNEALLTKALRDKPEDAYLLYQLGKDLSIYERHNESAGYFLKALEASNPSDAFRHDLIVRAMFTLKKANMHERAIELASNEFALWQHSPDYFFCVADLFLDWAILNPEQAEQDLLPIVESSWLKCLDIGEQPALSGSVAGRGSFLAAQNLAVLYENTGRLNDAQHYKIMAKNLKDIA